MNRLEKSLEKAITAIQWNDLQLIPAIAQDYLTHEVLMMAWMNPQSLALTLERKKAVYWSRSREKLWQKGESSGHEQIVHEVFLDCDADTLLLKVEQKGEIACHTGRQSCFYRKFFEHGQEVWQTVTSVKKDPRAIYSRKK